MSSPLPTPPRPPPPRPPLPALRLSIAPRRLGPSAVVAILVHVVVIGALIWERTTYLQGAVGGDGPQGGGGGGGQQLRYVTLPPAAAPAVAAPRAPVADVPLPVPQALTLPEPTKIEITPMTITPPAVTIIGSGQGAGGGPGGGMGTTTGTGMGSNEGPGSGGGNGGDIIPADPIGIFIPPTCARGVIAVMFSVEANGQVSRVELDPSPKDASCRRELEAKLRQYRFKPARTRDGTPVASRFPGRVTAH